MNVSGNDNSLPLIERTESPIPTPQQENLTGNPLDFIERFFQLSVHNTTFSTEIITGITTFMTMVYIIFITPQFLSAARMDPSGIFVDGH